MQKCYINKDEGKQIVCEVIEKRGEGGYHSLSTTYNKFIKEYKQPKIAIKYRVSNVLFFKALFAVLQQTTRHSLYTLAVCIILNALDIQSVSTNIKAPKGRAHLKW